MLPVNTVAPVPTPPGLPILFGHHVFEATRDGRLSHSIDGVQRAIVPAEGLEDYTRAWPHAHELVAKMRARFTPDQKKREADARKAAAELQALADAHAAAAVPAPIGAIDASGAPGWAQSLIDQVANLASRVAQIDRPGIDRPGVDRTAYAERQPTGAPHAGELTQAELQAREDARRAAERAEAARLQNARPGETL